MNQNPFRFRYVNELTGVFVLAALALLVAGVLAAGHAQRWFDTRRTFQLVFPAEGTLGVQKGTKVQILGNVVGNVRRIRVNDDGRIEGELEVRGDFLRFVRDDSAAVVKKQFGVAGDAFIDITPGQGATLTSDGAYLPCRKDTELMETITKVIEELRARVLPVLDETQKTLVTYRGLGDDLRNPQGPVMQSLTHVNSLLAGLDKGEGTAGKLLKDPALADESRRMLEQVNTLLADVRGTQKRLDAILDDVKQTTAHLPALAEKTDRAAGVVQGELRDVPGAVLQARSALAETETLLVGLQHHWLLRGAMPPARQPIEALTPEGLRPAVPEVQP